MSIRIKGQLKSKLISLLFLIISVSITYYIFTSAQKTRQIMHVPVLNKELEYGMKITGGDIEMKEVGVYNMPGKIIRSKDEIIDKFAANDLHDGRYIYEGDLMNEKPAMTVKEKIKTGAVAVETDLVKCVGGIPAPGDYVKVNIIVTDRMTNELAVVQDPLLNRVKILALQNAAGEYLKNAQAKSENSYTNTSREVNPSLIVFDVTPEQEKALLKGQYIGKLHLSLVPLEIEDKKSDVTEEENQQLVTEEVDEQNEKGDESAVAIIENDDVHTESSNDLTVTDQ